MKKGHRTIFQNNWSQKNNTLTEKTILFKKSFQNSYEKRPQNRFPKCLNPEKQTLSLKKQFFFFMLLNSYERAQNRLPKCLKPKKQTLSFKKQLCSKKAYKFIWKKATEPSSKMLEAKKTNTLIKN